MISLLIYRSPYGIVPNASGAVVSGVPPSGGAMMPDVGAMQGGEGSNHILLFTIFNPMYPITVVS